MKKIILSAIVALCAVSANAQTWAGGSLGFGLRDYKGADKSQVNVTVAPEIGYSLNEKWDVAVALGFGYVANENGVEDNNTTTFAVQPYARYTFAKSGIAAFFVDGLVEFGSEKPKGEDATTSFAVGLRPGVKVALSDKVCLVSTLGSFGYRTVKDSYDEFGLNIDNSTIKFGLYFNF